MTVKVPEIVFVRDGSIVTGSSDFKNSVAWERVPGGKTVVTMSRGDAGSAARHRRTTIFRLRPSGKTSFYWEADVEGDYALCEIRIYSRYSEFTLDERPFQFFGKKGVSRLELINVTGSKIFQKSDQFIQFQINNLYYRFLRLELNMADCTTPERSEICKRLYLIELFFQKGIT